LPARRHTNEGAASRTPATPHQQPAGANAKPHGLGHAKIQVHRETPPMRGNGTQISPVTSLPELDSAAVDNGSARVLPETSQSLSVMRTLGWRHPAGRGRFRPAQNGRGTRFAGVRLSVRVGSACL